ncbi:sphingomyelin phosphodiesterase 1 isoform X2 [Diabrotica virgifera virgifera]|uniref:Sphingomyelin phosphodiesterase n=1 Tax=Diabrotica virgifera virgifera TaxID=50390 RepID=A0ABM5JR08_DIAVI|nr:sphingomyelin phosphodiesterase 1 isoform X2 [Diabrotica virgifera virgifera]
MPIGYAFKQMTKGLLEYRKTGTPPQYLKSAVEKYNKPNYFLVPTGTFDKSEVCYTCALIVDMFKHHRADGMSDEEFKKELLGFCNLYKVYPERVCKGRVDLNAPIFLYIMDNTPNLTGIDACGMALQYDDCALGTRYNWTVNVPPPTQTIKTKKVTAEKPFNILHITDIHYDPRYTVGKQNTCNEPVCCQDDQPNATTAGEACGYWSDYINADIPWRTVVNALEQTKNHNYDYVYFTGDIVPHRLWDTSVEDNSKIISQILDAFADYYKVPVYPSLGNHEANPVDNYSEETDPSLSSKWLYDLLFQKLSKWMPIDEVKDTILKGGYYTVSPKNGLRVVVLNNNVCNSGNWWIIHQPNDPYDQLKWLSNVLLKAEQDNERVHLLYHMPSGQDECYRVWSREYRKIIERFSTIIAVQFNGHTHRDEFYVYYSKSNSSKAINMAWNGASVVTYDKANPSYKVFSIDGNTFDALDFEEWTFNLTLANLNPNKNPEWYKLYSFKNAFGVKSLEAQEINDLVMRMTQKHELLDQYYRYKFRDGDIALKEGCDDDCKKDLLCRMVKTEYGDDEVCEKVKELYDRNKDIQVLAA